jgi:hypothetical protein
MSENGTAAEASGSRFELMCGLLLAIYAALLAITDLFAGKYGDDEILAANEKSSAFMWYQSKSIKETLAEGQQAFLQSMLRSHSIAPDARGGIEVFIGELTTEIDRYKKEKREILEGSATVGRADWAQAVDGELGKVVGAKEWEEKSRLLSAAGDVFDMAVLFLQLCLVLGAISLIIKTPRSQRAFFLVMNGLGVFGAGIAAYALSMAMAVP